MSDSVIAILALFVLLFMAAMVRLAQVEGRRKRAKERATQMLAGKPGTLAEIDDCIKWLNTGLYDAEAKSLVGRLTDLRIEVHKRSHT
jgi:hypothetical protein